MSASDDEVRRVSKLQRRSTRTAESILADDAGIPVDLASSVLVCYRSVGIGLFGVVMRWGGMPLEKIALYMNSSQVSGKNQLAQSVRLTFKEGVLSPYRVVGPASVVAWFLQYSVMGFAFQFFDQALSRAFNVKPMYYGSELMAPPKSNAEQTQSLGDTSRFAFKTFLAPLLSGSLESVVANRAEVERYFGRDQFARIETKLGWSQVGKAFGPAYMSNAARNIIMCNTTFVVTPITYKLFYPQEKKSTTSLFWYGLGMNIFVGNVVAITQQALWGRSLDYCAKNGGQNIKYGEVIRSGLKKEGFAAFFTTPKWFSRVLMNAPAQGVLPWFYNDVLPIGEHAVLGMAGAVYRGFDQKFSRGHV